MIPLISSISGKHGYKLVKYTNFDPYHTCSLVDKTATAFGLSTASALGDCDT